MNEHDNSSRWLALGVILIGTFMASLGMSLVNLAIPKMMSVFGVDLAEVTWVLTAYTLAMGAIVPLAGFLSDTFGLKKLYILSLALFTLGSALCGLAWSNSSMIIFRILQALGGGLMGPVGMTIIFMIFPFKERGKAMGIWGVAAMSAPALGPTLGGYIISSLDWRLMFYLNVPLGILGVILGMFLLKETPTKPYTGNFDYIGLITSVLGISCTLYVVGKWTTLDWKEVHYPLLLVLGLGCLILFVINELTHPKPLLDLRVFKIRDFTLSQIITIITMLALMGGAYLLPLYLQNGKGYTAMRSGMILLPSAITGAVMMPISGILMNRYGAKRITVIGLALLGICSYELSFVGADTSDNFIIFVSAIRGIGLGLGMMPVSTVGMNAVPPALTAGASALSNTVRNIFSSGVVAILATIMTNRMNSNYARLAEQITPSNPAAVTLISQLQSLYMSSGQLQTDAQVSAVAAVAGLLQKQAYLDAIDYSIAFTVTAVFIAIVLVFFMSPENRKKDQHPKAPKHKEITYDKKLEPEPLLD